MTAIPPIGLYVTPDAKITFVSSSSATIQAQLPGIDHPVPVHMPSGFASSAVKVERLLRNTHLRAVYSSEAEAVHFEPTAPESKNWVLERRLSLPSDNVTWICRSDGKISYAFGNTIATWDWTCDTCTVISCKTMSITALAERSDGSLIIGNERGELHFSEEVFATGIEKSIEEIVPIYASNCCLIKFEDGQVIVFDCEAKQQSPIIDAQDQVLLFGNGTIISLNEHKMKGQVVCDARTEPSIIVDLTCEDIQSIKLLSETRFLALHTDKKTLSVFDLKENRCINQFVSNPLHIRALNSTKVISFDNQTLVVETSGPRIAFFSKENAQAAEPAGFWSITDMILLSDGSIMYSTGSTPSGIHVVTRDGAITFSKSDELTKHLNIDCLKELVDGSVIVKHGNNFSILRAQIGKKIGGRQYQIDKLKLKLQHAPTRLDLYDALALLYQDDEDKQYQAFTAGLVAAIKLSNFYQARRFYEKAKNIKPGNDEPCQIVLLLLKHSPSSKFYKQVLLDSKENDFELTKRACKKRLLIGEADFKFTEALLNKHKSTHPALPYSITATEFGLATKKAHPRIYSLMQRGVQVLFGIDGMLIHQIFRGQRFERIHWNCPFGQSDTNSRKAFKHVMPLFFQSCSQLQLAEDRIHITLTQGSGDYWKTRQTENPIVLGSTAAGYRLIRKRNFDETRYPGYEHVKTGNQQKYTSGGVEREFVFEKTGTPRQLSLEGALSLKDPGQKEYSIKTDGTLQNLDNYYFECSTDEDSSDYYESEEIKERPLIEILNLDIPALYEKLNAWESRKHFQTHEITALIFNIQGLWFHSSDPALDSLYMNLYARAQALLQKESSPVLPGNIASGTFNQFSPTKSNGSPWPKEASRSSCALNGLSFLSYILQQPTISHFDPHSIDEIVDRGRAHFESFIKARREEFQKLVEASEDEKQRNLLLDFGGDALHVGEISDVEATFSLSPQGGLETKLLVKDEGTSICSNFFTTLLNDLKDRCKGGSPLGAIIQCNGYTYALALIQNKIFIFDSHGSMRMNGHGNAFIYWTEKLDDMALFLGNLIKSTDLQSASANQLSTSLFTPT